MNNTEQLKEISLFKGMNDLEIESALKLISIGQRSYAAGELVFREGDAPLYAGIVLKGCIRVIREDYYGNRDILGHMPAPGLFGEALCFSGEKTLPVSVIASEESTILLLKLKDVALPEKLQANLLSEISVKVLNLTNKMRIIQKKTTAEKLMSYLRSESRRAGSEEFDIVFSRQELADYLGVERSAMIVELRKLNKQGRFDVQGKHFKLLAK